MLKRFALAAALLLAPLTAMADSSLDTAAMRLRDEAVPNLLNAIIAEREATQQRIAGQAKHIVEQADELAKLREKCGAPCAPPPEPLPAPAQPAPEKPAQ